MQSLQKTAHTTNVNHRNHLAVLAVASPAGGREISQRRSLDEPM
jgi:hypothetical protein